MPSTIDATKPTHVNPQTGDVRANFLAAKTEIEQLQVDAAAALAAANAAEADAQTGISDAAAALAAANTAEADAQSAITDAAAALTAANTAEADAQTAITDAAAALAAANTAEADAQTAITDAAAALAAANAASDAVDAILARLPLYAGSQASQGPGFNTETLVTDSLVTTYPGHLRVGSRVKYLITATKTTGAGTGPIIRVRYGTTGTVADAQILSFTFPAQSTAADQALIELDLYFRAIGSGSSAIMIGAIKMLHGLQTAGFSTQTAPAMTAISGGFNTESSNKILSVTINGGANANWTLTSVQSKLENID